MKAAVAKSGKTIKELAWQAGFSRTAMHNYLEGHAVPHPRRVPWLASALGCDAAELLAAVRADRGETDEDSPPRPSLPRPQWSIDLENRYQRLFDFIDREIADRKWAVDRLRELGIELRAAVAVPQAAEQSEDGQEAGACAQSAGGQP